MFRFSVFPNPLISKGEIEFEMLDDCLISINIVNNLGMRESLLNEELSKGYHSLKFSINKNDKKILNYFFKKNKPFFRFLNHNKPY